MKLSRLTIALFATVACARTSGDGPAIDSVTPPGTYSNGPVTVTIHGSNFVPGLIAKQNGGGGIDVAGDGGTSSQFQAWLDDTGLSDVRWSDQSTLTATVPALPADGGLQAYDLKVAAPYGTGLKPQAFRVSTRQPAQLSATVNAPARVTTETELDVSMTVTNTGQSQADAVTPGLSLAGIPAAVSVTDETDAGVPKEGLSIAGGSSHVLTWHFGKVSAGTYPMTLSAKGTDDVDGSPVSTGGNASVAVVTRASLSVTLPQVPQKISVGQQLTVEVDVSNSGGSDASNVVLDPGFGPGVQVSGLAAQTVPAGASKQPFALTLTGVASGAIPAAVAKVSGFDATDGAQLQGSATWPDLAVQTKAALSVAVASLPSLSSRAATGQKFDVVVTVTNTGEATAMGVQPTLQPLPAFLALLSGPTLITGSADGALAGGASAAWSYQLQAGSPGSASLTASASGTDANSNAAASVVSQNAPVNIEAPANLSLALSSPPPRITSTQSFTLTLTVTNNGTATATDVVPAVTAIGGLQISAAPPQQDIAGNGGIATFSFTVKGVSPGTANYTVSVSGTDDDLKSPVTTQTTGPGLTVVAPASLVATVQAAAQIPPSISFGQALGLDLLVANTGGSDATAVNVTGAPGSFLQQVQGPVAQDIAAGAQKIFHFDLQGLASGNAAFIAGATGTDAISGAPVPPVSATFPSVAVQAPAALTFTATQPKPHASIGEDVSFTITVKNNGEATANTVQPQAQADEGGTTVLLGPLPPVTLAGHAQADFVYTFHATTAGTASISASLSGAEANTSKPLNVSSQALGDVAVEAPAALTLQMSAPSQVSTGQAGLLAVVTVTNSGSATAVNVVPHLDAPGGVTADAPSPPSQDIPGANGQATFTFPLHAVSPGSATITPSAAGSDFNSGLQVSVSPGASSILVQVPAELHIASLAIPPALSTGQTFDALLVVQNKGGAVAAQVKAIMSLPGNATVVTPPDPQDIAGGDSATFRWKLQAGPSAGQVSVSASVSGTDQNSNALLPDGPVSSNSAALQLKASLSATLTIPASLSRGQSFTATLTVQNTGEATARSVMPQPDPPQAIEQIAADAQTSDTEQAADIPGGGSKTFTWSFSENGTGSGSFKLHAAASGTDVNTGLTISAPDASTDAAVVQEPAALVIDSLTLSPAARVSRGQAFTATLTVRNTGEAVAAQVAPSPATPSIAATGGALAITPDNPAPQEIAGGASTTFSWTYVENGTAPGSLSLSGGAAGLDQNSGASVSAAAAQSSALTVQQPAALLAVVAAPARISRGQTFPVTVTVTNPGEAVATAVDPGLQATPAGAVVLSTPPAQDIAGGASAIFTYTAHEVSGAETALTWSAISSGKDVNSRLTVSSAPAPAATAVDAPAALVISAFTLPSAITRGTSLTAQLIVTNTGDATAHNVVPSTPVPQTTGGAGASTATTVTAIDLPGHQAASFSWTFVENGTGPGSLGLSSTVSATDANSNAAISVPATASPVPVQDPSQLEVVSFTLPAKLSRGQAFTATLVVRNASGAGGTNVNNVTVATPTAQATGGAAAVTASAPSGGTLVPGQSATLTWSYTENGTAPGTLQLAALVTGKDAVSGATVSANAGSSAAVVQAPASLTLSLLTLPSRLARGQQFNAQLTVQNTGGATAASVAPAALGLAFTGGAHAAINSAPAAQDIAGGASATFNWTLTEDGAASGSLSATASVSATDANSAAALNPPPLSAGPIPVEQPASLSVVSLTAPAAVTRGQSFTVTLLVNNAGEAGARVTPGTLGITPAASAAIVSTPSQATVAGGTTSSFSWNVTSAAGSAGTSLAFSVSVTGRDRDSNASLTAGPATASSAVNTAPQLVIQSFALKSASGGTAINRGEIFTADLTVINNGQATANAVSPSPLPPAVSPTGGAAASSLSSISPVTLAGGQSTTFHWSYTESGGAAGTIALSTGLSGLDANSGAAVSAAPAGSNTLLVQRPSALSSTLSVAASIGLNTTFTVSFAVQNTGDATARSVTPSLTPSGTGGVTRLTAPAAADVAGGTTTTFQWTYKATANGSLSLATSATGTDINDAAVRTTNASATAAITDAALLATDAFGDGSPFAYVFEYGGRVFIGPRSNGVGAVSMQPDGTGQQSETFLFNNSAGDLNTANVGPFPSLGYSGCTVNTTQCGPDDENGRGDFYAGVLGTTELIFGAGTRSTGSLKHIYSTSQTTSSKLFGALALDSQATDGNTRGVTSMLAVGSRLYVGFAEIGGPGGGNAASNLNLAWSDNALSASPSFTNSGLDADILDGVGTANNAHVQMVDSMIVFNGLFYFANNGGCERSTVAKPGPWNPGLLNLGLLTGPEDWASCTPSSSQWGIKTSVTTTKTTDFTPSDRAVPQMAVFQGRLYLARNTTTGPQLWVCNPGSDLACDAGDWTLIAQNSTGDTSLSTFNDTTVTAISLLAATAGHLYVGYDSLSGVSLFRSNTATPINRADFVGQSSCSAASHPATCAGLNGSGLGKNLTRFWSDAVMTFAGTDYLYVSAGTGSVGASVYRVAQ